MIKLRHLILLSLVLSCEGIGIGVEDVVSVELPSARNLVSVDGSITNEEINQEVRLTRSNSFNNSVPVGAIEDANVLVQSRTGQTFLYSYSEEGTYVSNDVFAAIGGEEYRIRIQLADGSEIQSEWEEMPESVPLNRLFVDSFEENDPENPGEQILVFYPRIVAVDPENRNNYYRWRFFKNGIPHIEPESITIQDDRFFDGNLIPNNFRSFGYDIGDQMVVEFQSISGDAYNYLSLLKSQITSLGTSSGTTPAEVDGNLFYVSSPTTEDILGFFSAVSISADTIVVR